MCAKHKHSGRKVVFASVIGQDLTGIVDDCLTADGKIELIEAAKKYAKDVDDMNLASLGAVKAKSNPAKYKKMGQKDLQFVETARKFLPFIDGCTLSNETDWFTRFKVSYPCWFPPYSTSSVYFDSDNMSKRKAFIVCIAWAWAHHSRQTGTVCPYDLKV